MNPEAALKRVVSGCRRAFLAVALFSLAINLLMLTVPLYMMQMYDRVISSSNIDTLLFLSVIAFGGLLAMSLVEMMRSRIMVRLGSWVDRELSGPVLSGAMNDSLRAGGLNGASGLRELNTLRGFLTGAGIFPLLDAPWVPIFVAIIFMIHPTLGFLAIAGAVIVFLFALANDFTTRKPLRQANSAAAKALYRADAMVRNADVAAAMGMEPHLVRRWRKSNEEGLRLQALASDRAGGISAGAKFVRLVLQIAMLGVGAYLVTQNQITGGGMIAGSIILSRAMAPIEQSIGAWRGMVGARGAYESIKALLGRTPATGDAMSLPKPAGHISIEGVAFVPPGSQEPVLRGVSCEIEAGDTVGLIGPSASGKTTLSRIIVGSWRPTAGHARLDGADVFVWDAADRGRYIGYMPQDVELFDGTVRENIARMDEPDTDAVVAAATLAGVHELILHLSNGYETFIGDGGAKLSGGQRQRIALARALYGDPALVVLDEPNSNLDTEGEQALMDALSELRRRRVTTIVVAHRPTILAAVDKVIVMNQGRIEMMGPRDEVLAKVAPGSVDAVQRAIAANAASAPSGQSGPGAGAGAGPGASIEGTAQVIGTMAPTAPATSAASATPPSAPPPMPTSQGEPAAAPVMRIVPGGARAKPAGSADVTPPESATTTPNEKAPVAIPAQTARTTQPVSQPPQPAQPAPPAPSIQVGPSVPARPAAPAPRPTPEAVIVHESTGGGAPEPAAALASGRDEAVASLVSRITAATPPPGPQQDQGAPPAPLAQMTPSTPPVLSAPPMGAAPQPPLNGMTESPVADVASVGSAAELPPRWHTAARERVRRPLYHSPTTPGRLFPSPVAALTGNAEGKRFTPRRNRKAGDHGSTVTS